MSSRITNKPHAFISIPARIAITPIKQGNGENCLALCLRMVLGYYKIGVKREEVDFFFIKKGTTFAAAPWTTDVALFAKLQGLDVECFAYNLYLTDPSRDGGLSREQFLKKLEAKQTNAYLGTSSLEYPAALESLIRCIDVGCTYIMEKPNLARIEEYLNNNIPLIVTIIPSALYDIPGDPFKPHAIVLTGISDGKVYFIDPSHALEESIDSDRLMFGILQSKVIANPAYMLAIRSI